MSEFTPITTQEEFNAAIGERLRREKEKYADYDELKTKVGIYEEQINTLTQEKNSLAEKSQNFDRTIAEKDAKIHAYEIGSVKTKVAYESGIPFAFASRLSGETEEDIRADAANVAKMFSANDTHAPGKSTEMQPGNDGSLRALAAALTTE